MAHWAGTAGSRIIAVSSLFEIRTIPPHFTGEKSFTALPLRHCGAERDKGQKWFVSFRF